MTLRFWQKYLVLVASLLFSLSIFAFDQTGLEVVDAASLPSQAQTTLRLIKQGGPFPFDRDGVVFGNYEGILPKQKRGYYHEYTVRTPGVSGRGARRLIAGGEAVISQEYYYTDNHYQTFKRIKQ